jgi:hypothetical protein
VISPLQLAASLVGLIAGNSAVLRRHLPLLGELERHQLIFRLKQARDQLDLLLREAVKPPPQEPPSCSPSPSPSRSTS